MSDTKIGCDAEHGEFAAGNLYFRPVVGTTLPHTHTFDHVTLCVREPVRVRVECPCGSVVDRDLKAGELVHVPATHLHTITTDGGRALCIYAHRTPQGEVSQEFTGWLDAYAAVLP